MSEDSNRGDLWLRRVSALGIAVGLFVLAVLCSRLITQSLHAVFDVGDPGTLSRLLVNVFALQLVGFGTICGIYLWRRGVEWRSYLRIGTVSQWTVFWGTAVGLSLMLVVVAANGVFALLDIEPAEAAVGTARDPTFYIALFVVSTFVVVPLEELFFRGLIQRRLEESVHPALAIGVASLLFMYIHQGVSVGSGGELLALAMFFAFGLVLGLSYYLTENLLVPIIGHAMFNGIQILVRAIEVTL